MLQTIWRIIRAIVTAPDTVHWIKKYDAAKKEYQELERKFQEYTMRHPE